VEGVGEGRYGRWGEGRRLEEGGKGGGWSGRHRSQRGCKEVGVGVLLRPF